MYQSGNSIFRRSSYADENAPHAEASLFVELVLLLAESYFDLSTVGLGDCSYSPKVFADDALDVVDCRVNFARVESLDQSFHLETALRRCVSDLNRDSFHDESST